MIELHWTLDIPEWSRLDPERFWNNAAVLPTYRHARELSASDTLYFACLHGARHQMSSLRYLLDIVQILEHCADFIELDALLEQAEADRTSRRIQAVLSIVYDQFPHLHAVKPLPFPILKTPWTYDIVRSARQGKKSLDYYAYKLFFRHQIFDTWTHRLLSLRKAY